MKQITDKAKIKEMAGKVAAQIFKVDTSQRAFFYAELANSLRKCGQNFQAGHFETAANREHGR